MRHTTFSFAIICCLVLFSGFGCKGLSQQEQASISPITLTYWTVFDDVDQLKKFADAYKQIRPYVTITVRQVRYDEFDTLFTNALADDIGPDIISTHIHWLREYAPRLDPMPSSVNVADVVVSGSQFSQTVSVTPQTVVMPSIRGIESNFVGTVSEDVILRGSIFGLPLALDTLGLYYNKTILDTAGIPEPPKTWDEFLEAVKETTRINAVGDIVQSGVALGTGNNIENASDIFALLLLQNGVRIMQEGAVTFASGMEKVTVSHPTLEALRFYTDFARPTKEVYSWNEKQDSALTVFIRGRSAFYFGFAFDYNRIRSLAPQLDLGVIPIPQLNESAPVNVANYWVESVVKKSQHKDEAWDFIRFMTTPENIAAYTAATHQPSPLRSQVAAQQQNSDIAPFVSGILTAKNWYLGRNVIKAKDALSQLMTNYLLPYADGQSQLKRDAQYVINAATLIQQTL
ncbi:MAG: Carbohydrate ABC transporter substrate-binding protein, CUT1 family [Candidatus Magasanikbacteria bacterium GW2011_GWC2_42_27]|uniref:Carbohydrate ABC transporter substrate-binding protein, CUT1 family n=1 Tax=Candidatus Magasanikbacteria bacterium GW2011_GWE2_42_7 TaxID=1619052 RepID=A0A0G1DMT8_9BACT|nr:MAG: Carbohydrate ABC transporter substrate-binding protein, CUT1 family [Candidatus Magasanikbacteria bacterium GW2011_GWC2_42_27]KKS72126.1 MAG: Carbohydrate ABC transporter substrate-binding protein, CUT1 family [Candidatus Magasanikbacteria bacterium GW2011_GWE2_42_7]KKT25945.1 MAG: Carbohydrate ABC transporter substrate-binding protein, CUT1 family [Candidatus Magasanikbacteria bacterium GW2011_GWA2_43_9]